MNVGIDIGYSHVKIKTERDAVRFPSVAGTPDVASFSLNGHDKGIVIEASDGRWLVGEAVAESRFGGLARREDMVWFRSPLYRRLLLAGFTEISTATRLSLNVVTGLPVRTYQRDKDELREVFLAGGEDYVVHRDDRDGQQRFRVAGCRVIPQPFGALLAMALNDQGKIVNSEYKGRVGVIDVGGKTTNLLSVNKLADIATETGTADRGAWDIVRAVENYLKDSQWSDRLPMSGHELMEVIIQRKLAYFDQMVELGPQIDQIIEPMAHDVVGLATQLWGNGSGLEVILITGGGSHMIGRYIRDQFRHARVVDGDPVFCNVIGYWKFSQRLGSNG